MDRTERFYYIHRQLKAGRCLPLRHFLERFEISSATFKRDLEYLRDRFLAPIIYDPVQRGYRYDGHADEVELPGLWFTPDQLHALLVMAGLIRQLGGDFLQPISEQLDDRLQALLGDAGNALEQVRARVVVFNTGARLDGSKALPVVAEALINRNRLGFDYWARSTDEVSQREVSPQRLIHYRNNWYLDAWCHSKNGLRNFSVDSIRDPHLLDVPSDDIPETELQQSLGAAYGVFTGQPNNLAVLRFSADTTRYIRDEIWHPDQTQTIDEGCLTRTIPYRFEQEILMTALRYAGQVEVLAPKTLRRSFLAACQAAVAMNR